MTDQQNGFDRFMSRKVEIWAVGLIVTTLLLGMLAFGSIVQRQATGVYDFGAIGEAALLVATIPQEIRRTFDLIRKGEHSDLRAEQRFKGEKGFWYSYGVGESADAGYLLLSRYDGDRRRSIVELVDLNKQEILHQWAPDFAAINDRVSLDSNLTDLERDNSPTRARIMHPFATDDGGLIFANMSPLVKVDACGKIVWTTDGLFHHAIEPDLEGGVWASTFLEPQTLSEVSKKFKEDALTHVSADGKILFQKSLPQILIENGLERLVFGFDFYSDDPTHLNDIEPVRFDGPHWRRGDLFLSLRSTAAIVLYRPSEDRVIWVRHGPWSNQHDVDVLDEHRIVAFDNNRMNRLNRNYVAGSNDIKVYDFETDTVTSPFKQAMRELDVRTVSEGLSQILSDGGVFLEESNFGRTLRLGVSGNVIWSHVNRASDGNVYLVNWSRYLHREAGAALAKTVATAGCR